MSKTFLMPMDIPNIDGYKFIGIDNSLNMFGCTVKLNSVGMYSVYRDDNNESCFMSLFTWMKLTEEIKGD